MGCGNPALRLPPFPSFFSPSRLMLPDPCQPSLNPTPSLDINPVYPPPSSDSTPVPPSISSDLLTRMQIYQPSPPVTNNPWTPYSHGSGLSQSHASPAQLGSHLLVGGPGEHVIISPSMTSCRVMKLLSIAPWPRYARGERKCGSPPYGTDHQQPPLACADHQL